MDVNVNGNGGGGAFLLFVVFLVLKLTHVIAWSWLWVTAPLWIPFGLFLLIGLPIILIVWRKRDSILSRF